MDIRTFQRSRGLHSRPSVPTIELEEPPPPDLILDALTGSSAPDPQPSVDGPPRTANTGSAAALSSATATTQSSVPEIDTSPPLEPHGAGVVGMEVYNPFAHRRRRRRKKKRKDGTAPPQASTGSYAPGFTLPVINADEDVAAAAPPELMLESVAESSSSSPLDARTLPTSMARSISFYDDEKSPSPLPDASFRHIAPGVLGRHASTGALNDRRRRPQPYPGIPPPADPPSTQQPHASPDAVVHNASLPPRHLGSRTGLHRVRSAPSLSDLEKKSAGFGGMEQKVPPTAAGNVFGTANNPFYVPLHSHASASSYAVNPFSRRNRGRSSGSNASSSSSSAAPLSHGGLLVDFVQYGATGADAAASSNSSWSDTSGSTSPHAHGDDDSVQCAVCLESGGVDTMLSPCQHKFHSGCIAQWVERNYSCPLCRKPIELFVPFGVKHDSSQPAAQETLQRFTELWEQHYYHRPSGNRSSSSAGFGSDPRDYVAGPDDYDAVKKPTNSNTTVLADVSDSISTLVPEDVTEDHLQLLHATLARTFEDIPEDATLGDMVIDSAPYLAHAMVLERRLLDRFVEEFEDTTPPLSPQSLVEVTSKSRPSSPPTPERTTTAMAHDHARLPRAHEIARVKQQMTKQIEEHTAGVRSMRREWLAKRKERGAARRARAAAAARHEEEEEECSPQSDQHSALSYTEVQRAWHRRSPLLQAGAVAGVTTFAVLHGAHMTAAAVSGASSSGAFAARMPGLSTALRPTASTIPTAAVYFFMYQTLKDNIGVDADKNGPGIDTTVGSGLAAAGAATTAHLVRMIRHPAVGNILIPVQFGTQFAVFEQVKSLIAQRKYGGGSLSQLNATEVLIAAGAAGAAASTIVHPLRELATQVAAAGGGNVALGARRVLAGDVSLQPQSVLRGGLRSTAKVLPACVCTAVAYEYAVRFQKSSMTTSRRPRSASTPLSSSHDRVTPELSPMSSDPSGQEPSVRQRPAVLMKRRWSPPSSQTANAT